MKHLETLSEIVTSMTEGMNMNIEGETADLLDRRMMQLYGVAHQKLEKTDVVNASANLVAARNGDANSPFGDKLTKMIEKDGIPEIGLGK
jgi:hypothetical protein